MLQEGLVYGNHLLDFNQRNHFYLLGGYVGGEYIAHYKPVCQRSIPGAEEAVTPIVLRSIRPTSLFVSTPSTMEPVGLEPTTNGLLTTSAFAATLADVRGLDYPFTRVGCCPSSLYTFLFRGLARDCHQHYLLRVPRI